MTRAWPPLAAAAVLVLGACGDDAATTAPDAVTSPYTFHQHVAPILEARCATCHVDGGVGPFELAGYDDAHLWAKLASSAVEARVMPPFPPQAEGCAPLADPRDMPAIERDMLKTWAAGGRPAGDAAAPPEYVPPPETSPLGLGPPTHRFPIPVDFVAEVDVTEEYRCFSFDPALEVPLRVQAVGVETVTLERFHYAQISVVPRARRDEVAALEGVDGRPGWPCFFNPHLEDLDVVGRFTPGVPTRPHPAGTRVEIPAGALLIVDTYVHHYDYEPLDLSVIAWEAPSDDNAAPRLVHLWDDDFVIPANAPSVTATIDVEVVSTGAGVDTEADRPPTRIAAGALWSVDVHMHHWGRRARVEVRHPDGGRSCLLDIPRWDPEWQGGYPLATPFHIEAGDRLVASCEWGNQREDQPFVLGVQREPRELRAGLDEMQEMCSVRLVMTSR